MHARLRSVLLLWCALTPVEGAQALEPPHPSPTYMAEEDLVVFLVGFRARGPEGAARPEGTRTRGHQDLEGLEVFEPVFLWSAGARPAGGTTAHDLLMRPPEEPALAVTKRFQLLYGSDFWADDPEFSGMLRAASIPAPPIDLGRDALLAVFERPDLQASVRAIFEPCGARPKEIEGRLRPRPDLDGGDLEVAWVLRDKPMGALLLSMSAPGPAWNHTDLDNCALQGAAVPEETRAALARAQYAALGGDVVLHIEPDATSWGALILWLEAPAWVEGRARVRWTFIPEVGPLVHHVVDPRSLDAESLARLRREVLTLPVGTVRTFARSREGMPPEPVARPLP